MKILTILSGLTLVCSANAAVIAGYDFTVTAGDQSPAALVAASGANVSEITGFGGANAFAVNTGNGDNTGEAASGTTFGSTAGGSYSSASDNMTGASLADAISGGDYITFTVTADLAGTLDLTGFSIDKAINTSFIERVADEWNVLAKVNGDASAWSSADALLATDQVTTVGQGLTEFESTFIDLSDTSSFATTFQGIDSVEFRIYLWGANGTSYSNATRIDQIVVEGSVPEAVVDRSVFNVAKYQARSASSVSSTNPAQYGNDGFVSQDNRWSTSGSGPHWYEVELGAAVEVGSAHLYSGATSGAAIVENFSLQYYNGASWVNIPGTVVSGNSLPVLNLEFDTPVTAQRFRLNSSDTAAISIKELALYPPTLDGSSVPFGTDVDLNVAKLRQFEYSSVDGSNYPVLAIDGYVDDSSAWASTDAAGPHSFEVHFPQNELVRGVHLYSGFTGQAATVMEDFTVDYWDGAAWVTFTGGSITGNATENLSLWFDTAVSTARVRIQTSDSKQAVIRELVVFADNGGDSYPLWTDAKEEAPSALSFLDYEDSYYTIENRSTGENLSSSTTGSVMTTEEPLFQVLLNLGTDTYRLRSRETEACFEVSQASTVEGSAIVEGDYSSMPHQRWHLVEVGDGVHVKIVNAWTGMVLGLDGADVEQQADTGAQSQHWKINYEAYFPKKGQASHFHFSSMFKPSWAYRWTYNDENSLEVGQYYPMQWGSMSSSTAPILRYQPGWYGRANNTLAMGFNEPDNSDQSNMDATTAIYQWPRMQRMRLPLLGPAPDGLNNTWRQDYEAMAAERGLYSDYMAVHEYEPLGANTGSPTTLFNRLQTVYNAYGKQIYLTEFAVRDFAGDKTTWSRNHNYNWLAEFMWRAESVDYLKGWSLFEFGSGGGDPATTDGSSGELTDMNSPRLFLHFNNDSSDPGYEDLAECGLLLAGWDGVAEVLDDKPYIIHNRGRYLRLIDDPDSGTVGYADVLNREQTEQFVLKDAAGGNKYIEGLSSGRRLSSDGSSVGFAAAGTTGSSVEWELNEYQYGWYYIDHSATSTRLRITDLNVIDVASDSTTGDNLRFRFVVPAIPFESPAESEGNMLVGYDFDTTSSYPMNPSVLSNLVSASSLTSPMGVGASAGFGDTSGLDATGSSLGSIDTLGAITVSVEAATTADFAAAVAADDYVAFTVTPSDGQPLDLGLISFKATKKHAGSVDEYAVADSSGTLIGSAVNVTNIGATGTFDSFIVQLNGTTLETITAPTEFRIYAWGRGTTSPWGTAAAIDKVTLHAASDTNTPPTAIPQSVATGVDTPLSITLSGSDFEGDTLSYDIEMYTGNGTLTGTAPDMTYTPDPGYMGSDSFTFTVDDGNTVSDAATVSINVSAPISIALVGDGSGYDDANTPAWRSTNVAKPLDSDNDNVYGTEGLFFAGDATDGNGGGNQDFAQHTQVGASWATFSVGSDAPRVAEGGTFSYALIDDPTLPPGVDVADWSTVRSSGFTCNTVAGAASWCELLTFEIDETTPSRFRIGLMAGNLNNENWNPSALRISVDGGTPVTISNLPGTPVAQAGWVFFDVDLNGSISGTFSVEAQRRADTQGASLGGVTFDLRPGLSYSDWASSYGLTGDDALPTADTIDLDGLANAIEAWFGTDPTVFDTGLSVMAVSGATMTITHPQSENPPTDLTGSYQWSQDLGDWYDCDGVDGPVSGPTVSSVSNTVGTTTTVTLTASETMDVFFIRVVVE